MPVRLRPEEIEAESFRIIDREAGAHSWPILQWPVVRRVIHSSADFDYARSMVMSEGAVEKGIAALRLGKGIVTDTAMALAGINRRLLERFAIRASCHVADPDVAAEAARAGVTRSIMAMRKAAGDGGNGVFVIGNAPTALFELLRLTREEGLRPELVVALPVGFVGAEESKDALLEEAPAYGIPFITNRGRKGGSNVAAAAMNALLLLAGEAHET